MGRFLCVNAPGSCGFPVAQKRHTSPEAEAVQVNAPHDRSKQRSDRGESGVKSRAVTFSPKVKLPAKRTPAGSRFAVLRGTRQTGQSTDEIMNRLRGYDDDARDPGFAAGKSKEQG